MRAVRPAILLHQPYLARYQAVIRNRGSELQDGIKVWGRIEERKTFFFFATGYSKVGWNGMQHSQASALGTVNKIITLNTVGHGGTGPKGE